MMRSLQFVRSRTLPSIGLAEQSALVDAFVEERYASPELRRSAAASAESGSRGKLPNSNYISKPIQAAAKKHLQILLSSSPIPEEWLRSAQALGQEHARLGLSLEWMAESHRIFLERIGDAQYPSMIPEADREEIRSTLADRLLHDLSMQAAAFGRLAVANGHSSTTAVLSDRDDSTSRSSDHSENSCIRSLDRALMSAAELVVRARDEREMMDELCRLMIQDGLFAQAWIAKPNTAGDLEIRAVSSEPELIQHSHFLINVHTGDEERMLAVRAWRHSRIEYSNDRLADPEHPEIHPFYRKYGLHAAAVLPLCREGEPWALLALISKQSGIFHPESVGLLERIGRLIGHGLDALDLRQILEDERQRQAWLARHDPLTDLLNRRGIVERLREAVSRARRHEKMLAVAVLDLEGFKRINDTHGHPAGDLLLRAIADRLLSTLRQSDAIGRLGSDEFVFLLEDLGGPQEMDVTLARIQATVAGPVHLSNGHSETVRGSMGVTLFPQDDSAPERLLHHAERALYAFREAEQETAQRWAVFHSESDDRKSAHQKTILTLFRAGNLQVHYQPVVDLQTGEAVCIEALARLAAEDGSLMLPAEFLPRFGPSDLAALTHQAMAQSILDLRLLEQAGYPLSVSVNFEPMTLADPSAMQRLGQQVKNSGIDPSRIMLELLERTDTLSVSGSQEALRELKASGARIALDDVGSAYSSLLRVKDLPVDIIKLDRSFLIGLERQPKQLRFLMNLVHLAHALGLGLIAEGVESAASGDALAALGVRHAQGYAIARPMPIDALLEWLNRYKPAVWKQPTSILGTIALQLRDLDASGRILEQRPAFLEHLLKRDDNWDRDVWAEISETGPALERLGLAHREWRRSLAELAEMPGGAVNLASFQLARSLYEEEMFQAALEAAS